MGSRRRRTKGILPGVCRGFARDPRPPKRAVAAVGCTFGSVKIRVENQVSTRIFSTFSLARIQVSDSGIGFRSPIQGSDSGIGFRGRIQGSDSRIGLR